jgi:NADH:ubiquinone oxidoreductase subunit K
MNVTMDVAGHATETSMRRPLFLPTARQTNWLLIVGFLALGEALYIRYMALENVTTSLACQGGLDTWLCGSFRLSIVLFNHGVFGLVALAAALLNLLRPSIVLVAFTLALAAFGVVLHNADLSSLAVGVLLLSLARPAPAAA